MVSVHRELNYLCAREGGTNKYLNVIVYDFLDSINHSAARGEPQNQWAALCTAHQMLGQKSESQILEPEMGIEPIFTRYECVVLPLNYSGMKSPDPHSRHLRFLAVASLPVFPTRGTL